MHTNFHNDSFRNFKVKGGGAFTDTEHGDHVSLWNDRRLLGTVNGEGYAIKCLCPI
jgi:hypothetical protein